MPKLKANGIEIYYEIHGQGEPLVLVLGFAMNHFGWLPILPELAKHFKVILFDNRGAGETEVTDGPYSIEQMARDTIGLVRELGIEKASFLGQSMGSVICQEIARLEPDLIERMVLAGTFSKRKQTTAYAFELYGKLFSEGLEAHRLVELFFPFVFSDTFLSDQKTIEEIKEKVKKDPCPITPRGYKGQSEALNVFDSRPYLKDISVPTLVLGYEKDLCTFVEEAQFVKDQIPNAEFTQIGGVGHGGYTEKPQEFLNAVIPFLLQKPSFQ